MGPDIVEYDTKGDKPMFDLILGKATLHELGAVLDFNEKTIQKDEILLPMRNIVKLQLKPCITRALQVNALHAKEPVSTQSATKRVVEILDAKYEKPDLPVIVRKSCSHLEASERERLLTMLLKYEGHSR